MLGGWVHEPGSSSGERSVSRKRRARAGISARVDVSDEGALLDDVGVDFGWESVGDMVSGAMGPWMTGGWMMRW